LDVPTVLIVDDHERFRRTLRDWLEIELPGAVVLGAATAEEGLVVARRTSPDLVLMDIGLPGLNGIEATRQLVAGRLGIKVVMVSIHETAAHRTASAAAGALGYVAKSDLADQLRPLLGRFVARRRDPGGVQQGSAA
jgi:DNA-binding NarL/FixJ family response regulator